MVGCTLVSKISKIQAEELKGNTVVILSAFFRPGKDEYDFNGYLSNLDITLKPTNDRTQECATLSRLIYGLSSSYLLTGIDRYFDAAKAGVEFQVWT